MKTVLHLFRCACLVAAATSLSPCSAQVDCWAPGMTSSVVLSETNRHASVSLGRPYRYDVYGVAGQLQLGNRAVNASVSNQKFVRKTLGLFETNTPVTSKAYVMLQTGLLKFYPETLSISGDAPGAAVGPVQQFGSLWTLCDPRNQVPVNLAFHLPGSTLLSGLLSTIASPDHYNLNPTGHFYVMGTCHMSPPVMTGQLQIEQETVLFGTSCVVGYEIQREEQNPVFRPPFLGLDLGDVNLTVLGTPPAGGDGGLIDLPDFEAPEIASIEIDLSGSGGPGWNRILSNP